ncbi:hypothetical protein ACFO0N_08815 [Halobium salinum]|uniref:Uncharacterized protein n=1 Tax=Halobium salinum TaxID=1364940 RepID=A0ABD5PB03_9EURY|nr:hypothetical protein [Halobium salinum]
MGGHVDPGDDSRSDADDGSDAEPVEDAEPVDHDPWYRWGRRVLYGEMLLAVVVTVFSLYTALTGSAGVLV